MFELTSVTHPVCVTVTEESLVLRKSLRFTKFGHLHLYSIALWGVTRHVTVACNTTYEEKLHNAHLSSSSSSSSLHNQHGSFVYWLRYGLGYPRNRGLIRIRERDFSLLWRTQVVSGVQLPTPFFGSKVPYPSRTFSPSLAEVKNAWRYNSIHSCISTHLNSFWTVRPIWRVSGWVKSILSASI
jgi:hypothetical protein